MESLLRTGSRFLLGLLEAATAYILVWAALAALHRDEIGLPEFGARLEIPLVALLSAAIAVFVGRRHEDRGHRKQAAGVFWGAALFPLVVILVVVLRWWTAWSRGGI
ncbi:hypothetical protein ACWT_4500 [Actinoplanes sp. SE50]|uniref:hypothetical protein n=1 Tax=unclassified Actinoplanes TaxID=2626549 RepID=UPI00023ECEE5|nr:MULTISPECIES: hypothetical protein [unclassified Actinoplanes]AEV85522.1 hypothetical protein ACPL_4631 [Actinoplanes sp. SE50/110]ATO83915.1 hypothetical protein ACWT_4500 [Actinoplanes sp. SE50]SLM01325.1 hypothetical protein ACSP50_4561 [Actinoplanes sp. SE50/110]